MKILKKLRNNLNLTQKEFAKKFSIEQNTLSQYEADFYPSFKVIKKISEIFEVSIDYLLLEDKCFYPKSLSFIKKAIELNNQNNTDSKSFVKKAIIIDPWINMVCRVDDKSDRNQYVKRVKSLGLTRFYGENPNYSMILTHITRVGTGTLTARRTKNKKKFRKYFNLLNPMAVELEKAYKGAFTKVKVKKFG